MKDLATSVPQEGGDHKNNRYDLRCTRSSPYFGKQKLQEEPKNLTVGKMQSERKIISNIISYVDGQSRGNLTYKYQDSIRNVMHNYIKRFGDYARFEHGNTRITSMTWHPTVPELVLVGQKHGEIFLCNLRNQKSGDCVKTCQGDKGGGFNINGIKFSPRNKNVYYVATGDGCLAKKTFDKESEEIFLSTGIDNYRDWYTALDVSPSRDILACGDNFGNVDFLSSDGKPIRRERLHRNKVLHIEFNPFNPNLMLTSSVDRRAKLWDIRGMSPISDTECSELGSFEHNRPVAAAAFSLTNGSRILTTDQEKELRVYSTTTMQMERSITHPHRHFQYITDIKASWHPLYDIIVVGRYPEKCASGPTDTKRTVDFYNGDSGELITQYGGGQGNLIPCLCEFNCMGEYLATAKGRTLKVLKHFPRDLPMLPVETVPSKKSRKQLKRKNVA